MNLLNSGCTSNSKNALVRMVGGETEPGTTRNLAPGGTSDDR